MHTSSLIFFMTCAVFAQSATPPAFEVASIKPAAPPAGGRMRIMMGGDPGRLNYQNVSIRDVMTQAYQVKDFQISGPDWLNSVRFDIVAKMPPDTSKEQVRLMLQALLAERFQLKLHRETKDLPIYALVVGKNGPKLKQSETATGGEGGGRGMMKMGMGRMEGIGFTMSSLAEMLARQVGRPVVDMTELKGNYDFTLEFTPDESQRAGMFGGMPAPMGRPEGGGEGRAPADNAGGASIFAAVQEQLGLKLEGRKGPVEILVIDHAEKVPTEN